MPYFRPLLRIILLLSISRPVRSAGTETGLVPATGSQATPVTDSAPALAPAVVSADSNEQIQQINPAIGTRTYYRPGKRTSDWLKIKARLQQEFVVGGFTEGKGSRKNLGALLLGAHRNGKLHYFGHSGSGFTEKGIQDALKRMKPLFVQKSPFENPPRVPEKIQWVQPKLVCEVTFAEWTEDEQMRQTVFLGWRDDKDPWDVVKETPDK